MLNQHNALVLQHAEWLAHHGFVPLLLSGLAFESDEHSDKQRAVCLCKSGKSCPTPGKHPVVGWKQKPMDTPAQGLDVIRSILFGPRPLHSYNLGIRTGAISNCFVIDIDGKGNGFENFTEFLQANQMDDTVYYDTFTARTGSGDGKHLVYRYPRSVEKIPSVANHPAFNFKKNKRDADLSSVDIRGDGGLAVVAPSIHKSGRYYEWVNPIDKMAEAPDVFVRAVEKRLSTASRHEYHTPELVEVEALADRLCKSKVGDTSWLGKSMKEALNGQPIMLEGGAHDVFKRMLYRIAIEYPYADASGLVELFRPSIEARIEQKPDGSVTFEDVFKSAESALQKRREEKDHWENQLTRSKDGKVVSSVSNILLILSNAPEWDGLFSMNAREERPTLLKPVPTVVYDSVELNHYPRPVIDADEIAVLSRLEKRLDSSIRRDHVVDAMTFLFQKKAIDPFRAYLEALPRWDGQQRLDFWTIMCGGAEDTRYVRRVSAKWLMQVVNRTMNPGCQADYVLILEGEQGKGKSTLLKSLLPRDDLFCEDLSVVSAHQNKDNIIKMHGPAIIELAEMTAVHKSEVEAVKAFLTTRVDRFRAPFGRNMLNHPRRCVFAGTTNNDDYLRDATGNRRYWPVRLTRVNIPLLVANRDQLWAEALYRLRSGELTYLTEEEEKDAKAEQEMRMEVDPWTDIVLEHLDRREEAIRKAHDARWNATRNASGNIGNTGGGIGNIGNTENNPKYSTDIPRNIGNIDEDDAAVAFWLDNEFGNVGEVKWSAEDRRLYGELEHFTMQILYDRLGIEEERQHSGTQRRLSNLLKQLGYSRKRRGKSRIWSWSKG